MRVIAGKFKGRILKMPKGAKIRPSSQKIKAALFNILGEQIHGASFLELFAGSGNIGIEALSHGAVKVTFVERNRLCIKAIQSNLKRLGLEAEILSFDVERAIHLLKQKGEKFDFVFLDPPYYEDKLKNCLIKLGRYDILRPHSYVIAEHNKREVLPEQLPRLKLMFTKRYGDAALSFYRKEGKG
ncbi:MAG: 16S rRNA (guanine(966)-N(2))-methyltransferase RsmD [Omnitrophica bacterium]|nr:16S rRNA (guanine(966)-N(2))-methyltransferase RsmD [Candidatus Omnitrophota bacterium]